jgi:hypothetical protein
VTSRLLAVLECSHGRPGGKPAASGASSRWPQPQARPGLADRPTHAKYSAVRALLRAAYLPL